MSARASASLGERHRPRSALCELGGGRAAVSSGKSLRHEVPTAAMAFLRLRLESLLKGCLLYTSPSPRD
eukprot:8312742-Alexandrium_andersonii.AAC.1